MITCQIEALIEAPVERVWAVLEKFGDPSWIRGITEYSSTGSGLGMVRIIKVPSMTEPIKETLTQLDKKERILAYKVEPSSSLPLHEYKAEIRTRPTKDNKALVFCYAEFLPGDLDPEKTRAMILANYEMVIEGLSHALPEA